MGDAELAQDAELVEVDTLADDPIALEDQPRPRPMPRRMR